MTVPSDQKIGLVAATAIVAGNMMGSGIALLPSSFASIGSITILSWVIATIGALALGCVYAILGNRDPQPGGPIAYSGEVSPIFGYQAGLLYFHAGWIGNIGMSIVSVDYLSVFFPSLTQPLVAGITAIVIIWILTFINYMGSAMIGKLVTFGVILILVPVFIVSVFGWFAFSYEQLIDNWLVSKSTGSFTAVMSGVVLCIWAFIGLESASTNAGLVENPKRNIPLSTMFGISVAAVVYMASCVAIAGMFPNADVAKSGAPFSLALSHMMVVLLPDTIAPATLHTMSTVLMYIVSIAFTVGCLISTASWIMMTAQAGLRASNDGTLPKVFSERNAKGIPIKGINLLAVFCTVLMGGLMLISSVSNQTTQDMFSIVASVVVLFTIMPYFYSALQLIRLERLSHVPINKAFVAIVLSLIAIAWSLGALVGTTPDILIASILCMFIIFIFYVAKDRTQLEKDMNELRTHSLKKAKDDRMGVNTDDVKPGATTS